MSKPRILVTVLCGTERQNWINPQLTVNLMRMSRDPRFEICYGPQLDMRPWESARNMTIIAARQVNANYLLSFDNDNFVPGDGNPLDVIANARPEMDVIALTYGVSGRPDGFKLFPDPKGRGAICGPFREVEEIAGGVLIVHNTVWQRIPKGPWFRWQHADNEALTPGPGCCGEDVYFARLCRQRGLRVWTHLQMLAGHYRTTDLTGMVGTFAQLTERAKGAAR